jgi:hypothetical protein
LTKDEILAAIGISGVAIRTSANGSDVSTVTIGANQASAVIYLDGVTASAKTTATSLLNLNTIVPQVSSTTLSGSTITITLDNPVAVAGATATNFTLSSSTSGTNATVSNISVAGNVITVTLSGAPLAATKIVYTSGTSANITTGYGANLATFTSAALN